MDPETDLELPENYVNCEIFFGAVAVGKSVIRYFPLKNTQKDTVSYVATRSKDTNPIYYVYSLDKYEGSAEPGEEFTIKITYSPNMPGIKNLDYFKIMDSNMNMFRLCLSGECIGPSVSCSVRNLQYTWFPDNVDRKKVIELTNNSTIPAIFQFDVNDDHDDLFHVDQIRGVIQPSKYVYVTITFAPQKQGFFSRQLCCLVLHQDPILINIYGAFTLEKNTNLESSDNIIRPYPFPHEETVSFGGYLSDSVLIKTVSPPVSLSFNYLDFGRVVEDINCCNTLTTSLTNHLQNDVFVEWFNGQVFQAHPENLTIPGEKSALYELKFTPPTCSCLFSTILHGQVSWTRESEIVENQISAPIPINIRLIGHSFPKNQSWIPQVSIVPETVILPLTLPGYSSNSSFMLKAEGHLPVLFKLIPPKKTNFIMKPMVGLVRDFQIIIVQLQASSAERVSYVEKWNIELNGQQDRILPLYVKGFTDVPSVIFSTQNLVEFEPIQPGSQSCVCVTMKNTSASSLTYKFVIDKNDEMLLVDPPEGELCANEEILTAWCYTADSSEGVRTYQVSCRIESILKNNVHVGLPIEVPITVITRSAYSELCALPKFHDAGDVASGTVIKTSFYLFNFGESTVNFQLKSDHNMKYVILSPEFGECGPKEKIRVDVELTVTEMGTENKMVVSYYNRKSKYSKTCMESGALAVFAVKYCCSLFAIKIEDIVEHNYGYLFSNKQLWKLLKIDDINQALNETIENEIQRVNLQLPDCAVSSNSFYITFALTNATKVDARIILRRRRTCDCAPSDSIGFTNRFKIYNCAHVESFTMETPNSIVAPKSSQPLKMLIKYLLPDENFLSYEMIIGKNKTVELNISITGIVAENPILSVYNTAFDFDMAHIFIGRREAPIKAFWVYNNTLETIPFKVDDLEIVKLCNDEGFEVLKCLNCEGFLTPKTRKAILFRFLPIQAKFYTLEVPLMLGKKLVNLKIAGNGILASLKYKKNFVNLLEKQSGSVLVNSLIKLSVDCIITEPILVGSSTDRMIFITNLSETSNVKYSFRPCCIEGLVKIDVQNSEGILEPLQSRSLIIKIASLNEPCEIEVLLLCDFVDQTKLIAFERYLFELQEAKRKKQEEFTISDKSYKESVDDSLDLKPNLDKCPHYLTIALPIDVKSIGLLDKDNCLSVEHQHKLRPFGSLELNVEDFVHELFQQLQTPDREIKTALNTEKHGDSERNRKCETEIDVDMTRNVLECLIADTVFSDYFTESIKNLQTEPAPFYSQIKISDINTKKEEMVNYLTHMQSPETADLYKTALIEDLNEMYKTFTQNT